MLRLDDVHAFYGKSHILQGINLEVGPGEIVSLMGRNGAGKTTTLRVIAGLVPIGEGSVSFGGVPLKGLATDAIARSGIGLVPEHRGIFISLSVEENLAVAVRSGAAWTLERVYERFPLLRERRRSRGGHLSGGERQILAIARALVNGPRLLMIDEATQGLAPAIVAEVADLLREVRDEGVAILLVEQSVALCMELADRHYVIEQGRIVYGGDRADFAANSQIHERYLAL
jgi:branched-chain amino acid transport system ATP-binding protein